MTDHPQNPNDPISNSVDLDDVDCSDEDLVEAVFVRRPTRPTTGDPRDPYDLGWLFLCWSWEAGHRNWNDGLRALVRALRGLEETGFIERRRIRRAGHDTHHGFVLTKDGHEALKALSGDWIKEMDG